MKPTPTRAEHLQWCKDRAMQYVQVGEYRQAFWSFSSDVMKHEGTSDLKATIEALGFPLLVGGLLNTEKEMRDYIQGFV